VVTYLFDQFLAVDPAMVPAANAAGQVYAPDDIGFTTPLPAFDSSGTPMLSVDANSAGVVPPFQVEDTPVVVWRSGQWAFPRTAAQAVVELAADSAAAAQAAAEAAAVSAAAAAATGVPPVGADNLVLTTVDGAPAWAPSTGGATVHVVESSTEPTTAPPEAADGDWVVWVETVS